ncbi:MAG: NUDIX domain-containing protein [Deltaproteobacteria bacterium]|nr:NUDIX domain-containing protein [Deltaproteobacteria bacterium]
MKRVEILKVWLKRYAAGLSHAAIGHNADGNKSDEHDAVLRMLKLLQQGEEAFSRQTLSPGHFTNSAFVVYEKKLLLIHHQKLKMWLQPGGHVEHDDQDLLAGAKREVGEETLLPLVDLELVGEHDNPIFDVDIHEIPANNMEDAHFHFDVRFLLRATEISKAGVGDGVKDLAFVDFRDAKNYHSDASVMRAVAKLDANT